MKMASLIAQWVKNMPERQETHIRFLGWEDPLEKEMANPLHYSFLENTMDRGVWQAAVHGVISVRHDLVTKPPPWKLYLMVIQTIMQTLPIANLSLVIQLVLNYIRTIHFHNVYLVCLTYSNVLYHHYTKGTLKNVTDVEAWLPHALTLVLL